MKHKILTLAILLFSLTALSQTDTLAIKALQQKIGQLQTELRNQKNDFSNQIKTANEDIANLQTQVVETRHATSLLADSLGIKIDIARTITEQQITEVDKSLGKTTLWAIIGILFAVIISGIVYLLLRKKQQSDKTDIVAQLTQTKQSIDEKLVNEFAEIVGALRAIPTQTTTAEPDHSLALKMADQVTAIERGISLIDEKTKGLQRLKNSVTNIKDNLAANGYELVELAGKRYNQGMNLIIANSVLDENLKSGEEIITRVIKPQVNFNDKMIQAAQVEVSVGY